MTIALAFSLDSGVHRSDAHRFYLMKRMKIAAHHFTFFAQLGLRDERLQKLDYSDCRRPAFLGMR